ncbi:tRNA lysidine(34) synthetase TilS [Acinetobacter pittii]|jgi:tRNA(Ile)-lysidine synthase|uniref:tRNA lysidine(34) synthetase TilS n=1 Tax=Acinetobacter TaxID=469 RepID=UPI0009BAA2A8|nr:MULTISPECIES: tRNA lysidine(34) synthetase TilS [Acinetobacter]MBJ8486702.1 tRNA lysidine(34) synthetase TilS [Acinetobacter pittii]MBS5199515.1 tRNA lysidine(34) synthetase TilS [Acinetobacter sp.]MCU4428268.1 tRNA lysidine(34) synthetase TilS [Acinetobacter pittii]MDX8271204.1 tRNA lysidine(34) synthetase TilS [Acinetobacter pittii]OTM88758.1 tRNA lysidine(34) synthetase TilS [Acinetobacter pittii]
MRSTLSTFNEVWQRKFRHRVLKQAQEFSENSIFLIGCSGGMDSMLLLHLMSQIFPQKIRVIYIDHQLQSKSAEWGEFVAKQATHLNIPYTIQKVQVTDGNLEAQARQARYQAYLQHLQANEILVLAHHQQDQAETVILRLLSGAGVDGLAAMQSIDHRVDMTIWRPFLDLTREQIAEWTTQLEIEYVVDPTNYDIHYDRAWSREELWPFLQNRFPKMQQALSRTSYLMQDASEILEEVLKADLQNCGTDECLDLTQLLELSSARQRQLLSVWMKGDGQYRPAFEMVERLKNEVIVSKSDAQAALHWNQFYYVRYQHHLYRLSRQVFLAEKLNPVETEMEHYFQLGEIVECASGQFQITQKNMGLSASLLNKKLKIIRRQGGEKVHLYGRVGQWPLKKAIQEAHILPWLRHTIQILVIDNVMLGVFTPKGFWLAQSPYCEQGGWQPDLISYSCNLVNGEDGYDKCSK